MSIFLTSMVNTWETYNRNGIASEIITKALLETLRSNGNQTEVENLLKNVEMSSEDKDG
jgi:hypothetical protein